MAQNLLQTRGMPTNTQLLPVPVAAVAFDLETTQLSAVALAMVVFVERLPGPANSAQRRDLKASASKLRLHLMTAGGASRAKRRRECYERAWERLAVFACVLVDLLHVTQISQKDFDAGRALARRGKALLASQLAALDTMPHGDQRDRGKLDELLVATDHAASTAPTLDGAHTRATVAVPGSPLSSVPPSRQVRHEAAASAAAPSSGVPGKNGGPPRATAASPPPDRRSTRS